MLAPKPNRIELEPKMVTHSRLSSTRLRPAVSLTRTQNRNTKKGAKRTKREGTPDTPGEASQGRNDPEPNPPGEASPTRAEPGKGAK